MEQHVIYALVGNFLSIVYSPMWWKYEDSPESELAPIPALVLFQYLKKQGKKVKLKLLVPHSLFINRVNKVNLLTNINFLTQIYKEDVLNYYSNFDFDRLLGNIEKSLQNLDVFSLKRVLETLIKLLKAAGLSEDVKDYEAIYKEAADDEETLKGVVEDILNDLKSKGIKAKLEKLNKTLKEFESDIDIVIVPSSGSYRSKENTFKYSGWDYTRRVLKNYLIYSADFLNCLSNRTCSSLRVYLDISVGLNSLVAETLEAYYNAIVLWNFYFLGEENNPGKFYILSSEPVLGSIYEEKNFQKVELNKKAFFEKPLTWKGFQNIRSDLERIISLNLTPLVKKAILAFNATKLNIPLTFSLYLEESSNFLSSLREVIEKLLQQMELKISKTPEKVFNIYLDNKEYFDLSTIRNLTYLLMLGANLDKNAKKYLGELYTEKSEYMELTEKNLQAIQDLYSHYNLETNKSFLGRDWNDLKKRHTGIWQKLCEIKGNCERKPLKKYLEMDKFKRNFLAHSGFEDNITELYGNKVRYIEPLREKIKEFILNL